MRLNHNLTKLASFPSMSSALADVGDYARMLELAAAANNGAGPTISSDKPDLAARTAYSKNIERLVRALNAERRTAAPFSYTPGGRRKMYDKANYAHSHARAALLDPTQASIREVPRNANTYLSSLFGMMADPHYRAELRARKQNAPAPAPPVKYVPAKKKGFTIARPKLGEETSPNYIVSDPEAPQFNMPNVIGGNEVTPVDIGTPNIPALPEAKKAQPLTGGDANAWRANASAALGKAAPSIAGVRTPAPADAPIVRPKSNKPALGSVEDRRAVYAKAGQPVNAPIVRPVRPANAAEATAPASRTAAIGNAMMRGARPNAAPASAAVQPRTPSIKDITAADMKKYRKYTAAGDMNSEMDRWKTLQAMQGNRNASNKDYRAAKKRGEVK